MSVRQSMGLVPVASLLSETMQSLSSYLVLSAAVQWMTVLSSVDAVAPFPLAPLLNY